MVTVYRIVKGDTEVYRGKRIAVIRKLATLSRRVGLEGHSVQHAKAISYTYPPASWSAPVSAAEFVALNG